MADGNLEQDQPGIEPEVDWYLQSLVRLANNQGAQMGITLMVRGTVITGQLIGGKTYFEKFGQLFADGWNGDEEGKKILREAMSKPAQTYSPEQADAPISYIHLENATVRTPSGSLPSKGVLWRGRLSEVSGFFLGSLS